MIRNLHAWLQRPYPFPATWQEQLRGSLTAGAVVALFLFIFRPFGAYAIISTWEVLRVAALFGLVTAAGLMLSAGLLRLFPRYAREQRWTLGKELLEMLLSICIIAVLNLLAAHGTWGVPITLVRLGQWLLVTGTVAGAPILVSVALTQHRLMRRYRTEAELLSAGLQTLPSEQEDHTDPLITLSGENQSERLTIRRSDLYYLEAADNYVAVCYLHSTRLQRQLLRSPLKRMEAALAAHPQLFRCHRAYLVNLDHVHKISGNAQGYRLHLTGVENPVPVSRSLNAEIRQRLRQMAPTAALP
ncbi:MAG: LytTR family DNA-binding domain-containing protein [Bacteroidia bacterium]|nr:LytTR family DNA-binding domain-containing protein [Bacteroidia bacterium]